MNEGLHASAVLEWTKKAKVTGAQPTRVGDRTRFTEFSLATKCHGVSGRYHQRLSPSRRGTDLLPIGARNPRVATDERCAQHHANAIAYLKKHYGDKRPQQGSTQPHMSSARGDRDGRRADQHADKEHQSDHGAAEGTKNKRPGYQPIHLRLPADRGYPSADRSPHHVVRLRPPHLLW